MKYLNLSLLMAADDARGHDGRPNGELVSLGTSSRPVLYGHGV